MSATIEELTKEYSALPEEELARHYTAAKYAMTDRLNGKTRPATKPPQELTVPSFEDLDQQSSRSTIGAHMNCTARVHHHPLPDQITARDALGPHTKVYVDGKRIGHAHTINIKTGTIRGWAIGSDGRVVRDPLRNCMVEVEEVLSSFDLKCRHCDETFFSGPSGPPQD